MAASKSRKTAAGRPPMRLQTQGEIEILEAHEVLVKSADRLEVAPATPEESTRDAVFQNEW